MSEIKQVIVVRKDLHMRAGKIAAQVAHASMKVILDRMLKQKNSLSRMHEWWLRFSYDSYWEDWLNGQFTKIVLYVNSLEEMKALEEKAIGLGIPNALIIDAGKTEFHNQPTPTALALGPYDADVLSELTGDLRLI